MSLIKSCVSKGKVLTHEELLNRINLGEDNEIEFKSAKGGLPKSMWDTVSAFANTNGGYIILGVEEDDGIFSVGSARNSAALVKNFWDLHNSAQKLSSPLCREEDISILDIDGSEIVVIHIPVAHRTQRPVFINGNPYTGTYKRNREGDYRCTKAEISQMYRDASDEPQDFGIIEKFTMDDIDLSTLHGYRNRFNITQKDHPYSTLSDQEFLLKLGGYKVDRKLKEEGLTLAGLLMFGKESSILEAFPHFHLDYQENFSDDPDVRWTHRITSDGTWECNIFNFYMRVYNRLVQDIEVPFALDSEGVRKDETHVHEALREALVNTLVHANHQSSKSTTVIKSKDYFFFRNPGRLRITLEQVYQGGMSDVRNPYIQRIFQLIGLGEKAGSGFIKILRAWNEQHWMKPIISEDAVHELTSVKLVYKLDEPNQSSPKSTPKSSPKTRDKVLDLISGNNRITTEKIAEILKISKRAVLKHISNLKDDGILERIGSAKGGHWEVKK